MVVLGIDQAMTTGWASVLPDGRVFDGGSISFRTTKDCYGESRGMAFLRFSTWLRSRVNELRAATRDEVLVVHERTLIFRSGAATEVAAGFKACIEQVCAELGCSVTSVNPTLLKRWATGDGRADKAKMTLAARMASGSEPKDDNHADAILIALLGAEEFCSRPRSMQEAIRNAITPPPPPKERRGGRKAKD